MSECTPLINFMNETLVDYFIDKKFITIWKLSVVYDPFGQEILQKWRIPINDPRK